MPGQISYAQILLDQDINRTYNNYINVTFDHAKNERNIEDRGISFECAADFDFDTALFVVDDRKNYGETRIRALGLIGTRLHVLVFTETQTGIRVISLRKANKREVKHYEQET